jgi:hypothetical protein
MVVTYAPAVVTVHVRCTSSSGKGNNVIFNARYFIIQSFSLLDIVFSG